MVLNYKHNFGVSAHSAHFDTYNVFVLIQDETEVTFQITDVYPPEKRTDKFHLCEFCRGVECLIPK